MVSQLAQSDTESVNASVKVSLVAPTETQKNLSLENSKTPSQTEGSLLGTLQALSSVSEVVVTDKTAPLGEEQTDTTEDAPVYSFGGLIGGSFLGDIVAASVEQQKMLMNLTIDYLEQFGLSIEAANLEAQTEYDTSMYSAYKQFQAGKAQAMQEFTACAASGLNVVGTVGTIGYSHSFGKMKAASDQANEASKVRNLMDEPYDPNLKRPVDPQHNAVMGDKAAVQPFIDAKARLKVNAEKQARGEAPDDVSDIDAAIKRNAQESLDWDNSQNGGLKIKKIEAIKSDYETQGFISKTTKDNYSETKTDSEMSFYEKKVREARGTQFKKPLDSTDPEAQIAINELKAPGNEAKLKEAKKQVSGALSNAQGASHQATQEITMITQLINAAIESAKNGVQGSYKLEEIQRQKLASELAAEAKLLGSVSNQMLSSGQSWLSLSGKMYDQSMSNLSSTMDAARRASTKN